MKSVRSSVSFSFLHSDMGEIIEIIPSWWSNLKAKCPGCAAIFAYCSLARRAGKDVCLRSQAIEGKDELCPINLGANVYRS